MQSQIKYLLLLPFLLSAIMVKAQNSDEPIPQGSIWLETQLGISFYHNTLARFNNTEIPEQDLGNSIKLRVTPKFHYALADRLLVGGHLGIGYEYYEVKNSFDAQRTNYQIGSQVNYWFIKFLKKFYLNAEIGANYNHIQIGENFEDLDNISKSYFKSYFNLGLSTFIKDKLGFSLVFKDIISYHSSTPNFNDHDGFHVSNAFQDLLRFPHFSLYYKLN